MKTKQKENKRNIATTPVPTLYLIPSETFHKMNQFIQRIANYIANVSLTFLCVSEGIVSDSS